MRGEIAELHSFIPPALSRPLLIPFLLTLLLMKTTCVLSSHFPTPSPPDETNSILSPCVCSFARCVLRVGFARLCEGKKSKPSGGDPTLAGGQVRASCQLGHGASVSTRFPTLKRMTHVANASTCLLNQPQSNHMHMLLSQLVNSPSLGASPRRGQLLSFQMRSFTQRLRRCKHASLSHFIPFIQSSCAQILQNYCQGCVVCAVLMI